MNVYYRRYRLTPLQKLNRLSSVEEKLGVHLMVEMAEGKNFADYFPHPELGDVQVDQFLEEFSQQKNEYEKKVWYFLQQDHQLRKQTPRTFKNHQLWDGKAPVSAPVVKYKLKSATDKSFLPLLEQGIKLRLDANGVFHPTTLKTWSEDLPPGIEYVEDPMRETDWSNTSLPLARDFIAGSPYTFTIYKPSCEFMPTGNQLIFSSYMGSDLGRWHTYCELLAKGDLHLTHGIHTPGLFEEQLELFSGDYQNGFLPHTEVLQSMYQELHQGPWKLLCSV